MFALYFLSDFYCNSQRLDDDDNYGDDTDADSDSCDHGNHDIN